MEVQWWNSGHQTCIDCAFTVRGPNTWDWYQGVGNMDFSSDSSTSPCYLETWPVILFPSSTPRNNSQTLVKPDLCKHAAPDIKERLDSEEKDPQFEQAHQAPPVKGKPLAAWVPLEILAGKQRYLQCQALLKHVYFGNERQKSGIMLGS